MIRTILSHSDQSRLAFCVHRMFILRALILEGVVRAGDDHPDLPRPLHPSRQWWLLGSTENLDHDNF